MLETFAVVIFLLFLSLPSGARSIVCPVETTMGPLFGPTRSPPYAGADYLDAR